MTDGFDLDIPVPEMDKTIVSNAERTQAFEPVKCSVCQSENLPGEEWCADCGFLLGSEPGEAAEITQDAPRLVSETDGREYWIVDGENRVGREGPELVFNDPSVSRRHALLVKDDSGLWVEDLGSTNGTRVENERLTPGERRKLKAGQLVRFGNAKLRLQIPGAESSTEEQPVEEEATVAETPVAWLVGTDGTEFPIPPSSVTLGRRQGNGIVLQGDQYISGMHGQLLYQEDGFSFVDLGSTNGSLVNGQRAVPDQPIRLSDGDQVTLGRTEMTFKLGDLYSINPEGSESETETEAPSET